MAPKAKRRKVVCNTCKRVFDSDYRKRHDLKHHGGKLQRIHGAGAPANPFEVVKSKRSVDVASSSSPTPSADDHFDFASTSSLPPPCDPVVDENNTSESSMTVDELTNFDLDISDIFDIPYSTVNDKIQWKFLNNHFRPDPDY